MTPKMLRQLWSLIENTQPNVLLKEDDATLIQWLLNRLGDRQSLDRHQTDIVTDYIRSKMSLIRDLAETRC